MNEMSCNIMIHWHSLNEVCGLRFLRYSDTFLALLQKNIEDFDIANHKKFVNIGFRKCRSDRKYSNLVVTAMKQLNGLSVLVTGATG